MHYYKFNIKDWTRDTAHLSVEEEGVYRRLLDHYYETESPIPAETHPLIRRLRLAGHEKALEIILSEFFVLESDGYHQSNCDKNIAAYHAKAETNRSNGRKGGRPEKPKENPDGFEIEPTNNLNHKPLTTNQEPEDKSSCDQQAESPKGAKFSYKDIQDAYNEICSPTFPACAVMNDKRKRQIKAMGAIEFMGSKPFTMGIEVWRQYFADCLTDPHWCGQNDRGWRADFDFVTNTKNVIKLMERMN
jgi:uncharacterized protein YdaU (DUF1376 family)